MNGLLKGALVATAIAIPVILFWGDLQQIFGDKELRVAAAKMNSDKKDKKKDKEGNDDISLSANVRVVQRWELPSPLTEISGMAYLGNNQFACIQDELGKIFIYNTASSKIEKEIPFGDPGDYEGIAVAGNTAYVLRADGNLSEVTDFMGNKPSVRQYNTPLTEKHDVEGLCYDQKNNRLLLAIKGNEPNTDDYKGIYGFDLKSKKMAAAPVYKIDLTHHIWKEVKGKKAENKIQPSDIDIHPITGDLYITDGGTPKVVHRLSKSDFEQPEGITLTPNGELYISSEGDKGAGIIARVEVSEP